MPHAAATFTVTVCGGQGARRSRNWRHNRPNSPYRLARDFIRMASVTSLSPAQQQSILEQARLDAQKQQQQSAPTDDC